MQTNLDVIIKELDKKLDEFVTPTEISCSGIVSLTLLQNMRDNNLGPPYFRMARGQIKYLKKDIFSWLKKSYKVPEHEIAQKKPKIKKVKGQK